MLLSAIACQVAQHKLLDFSELCKIAESRYTGTLQLEHQPNKLLNPSVSAEECC